MVCGTYTGGTGISWEARNHTVGLSLDSLGFISRNQSFNNPLNVCEAQCNLRLISAGREEGGYPNAMRTFAMTGSHFIPPLPLFNHLLLFFFFEKHLTFNEFPIMWLQATRTQAPPTLLIFSSALLLKNLAFTMTGCFGSFPFPRTL